MKTKILQRSPNNWSCLPTSFAMVLGVPVKDVIEMCGHDGSQYWWVPTPEHPNSIPEPYGRRGFHIQEMIWVAYQLGYSVTPFEGRPQSKCWFRESCIELSLDETRMKIVLVNNGVLTGMTLEGQRHAIAYIRHRAYDPSGRIKKLADFGVETFWYVQKQNQIIK
jgi:hypothetical protein